MTTLLEPWLDSGGSVARWHAVGERLVGRQITGITYLQTPGIEMSAEQLADSVHVVEMAVLIELSDGSNLGVEWAMLGVEAGIRLVLTSPSDPSPQLAGTPLTVTGAPAFGRLVGAKTESVRWLMSHGEAPGSRSVTGMVMCMSEASELTVVLGEPSDREGFRPSPDTLLVFTETSRTGEYLASHSNVF